MKRKLILFIVAILALTLCFSLASCGDEQEENPEVKITSVEVVGGSYTSSYFVGSTPDFSSIKLKVNYSDGHSETVNAADAKVGTVDTSAAGAKVLTVTYKGFSVNVTINVVEPTVTGIKILANTVNSTAKVGSVYSVDGMVVEASYNNGTKRAVANEALTVTLPDTSTTGTKLLKVTYLGFEATLEVTVTKTNVTAMTVYGNFDSEIKVGAALDTSSLNVEVSFDNGTKEIIGANRLTITTIDTSSIGTKELKITYDGFTINYPINVYGAISLELNTTNIDTQIIIGDAFDTSEITATVVYSDKNGTTKSLDIDDLTIVNNINTSVPGEQKFKVSYENVSDEITVKVIGIESVTVNGVNSEVLMGGTLDVSNITLTVKYAAQGVNPRTFTPTSVSAFDTTAPGAKKLTISYALGTVEYDVKVCGPVEISVEDIPRFFIGQKPSLDDMKVYLVYDDSAKTPIEITEYTTNIDSLDFDADEDKDLVISAVAAGKTLTKTVKLSNKPLVAESLEITSYDKLLKINHDYNMAGIVAKVTYTTGASKNLTVDELGIVSQINKATAGEQTLKVSYTDENSNTVYAQVTVKVLPVASIEALNLPSLKVNVGTDVSFDGITIEVSYSDGTDTLTENVNKADAEGLEISAFDKNVIGDKKITISYLGKSCEYTLHFKGIVAIEIVSGTYKDHIREGYELDISNVEIKATYSDGTFDSGKPEKFSAQISTTKNPETNAVTIKVTLGDLTPATVEVTKIVTVAGVDALNGTVPSVLFKGDTLPLDKIALTVYYDVDGVLVPYLVKIGDANLDYSGSGDDFDKENGTWASTGDKMLTLIFDKDTTVKNDLGHDVPKWSAVARISVIAVESITLVDGTVTTTTIVGEEDKIDVKNAQFRVDFTDGSYTYIKYGADGLVWNWDNYSTATEGDTTVSVTYKGATATITVSVINRQTEGALIFGAESPISITARESYKTSFKNSNNDYVVGDDNAFKFVLVINALDANDTPISNMTYTGKSTVYLLNKDTRKVVGAAGEEYVTIDDVKHTFDFTDAAIGNYFKIVSAPAEMPEYEKELVVNVVDGYNIYNAKELNLITNYDGDIDGSSYQFTTVTQLQAVKNFLGDKYVDISGAVLHGNIDITPDDLPPEYFYNQNGKFGLYNEFSVYNRNLTDAQPNFNLYGNYFTIYSYNLPCVVEKGVGNNSAEYSMSQLFLIRTDNNDALKAANTPIHTNHKSNIVDVGFRDNDPNSNDQAASARHMLGLIGMKFRKCEANITNINIEAFYVSLFADYDNIDMNIKDSNIYNAWQGHLFIYNDNNLAGNDDEAPGASHQGIKVNIENSLMGKCGGPVILSQNKDETLTRNNNSGANVKVDDSSELYSYVTGQEAWFVALGASSKASSIIALDQIISGYSATYSEAVRNTLTAYKNDSQFAALAQSHGLNLDEIDKINLNSQYTSTNKIQGVSTINLIMVTMPSGVDIDSGRYTNLNTTLSIGNVDNVLNLNKNDNSQNAALYQTNTGTGGACTAPIIQTTGSKGSALSQTLQAIDALGALGGTCYANPAAAEVDMLKKVESDYITHSNPDRSFFFGEYASIYMGGMGVALEFYSPTNVDK